MAKEDNEKKIGRGVTVSKTLLIAKKKGIKYEVSYSQIKAF